MADSNDDLLEDGDLSESNFEELDLAEEDALLADDDEKPYRGAAGTSEDNLGAGEEDDYLIIEADEDLSLNDEEGQESKRISHEANNNDNDADSDDDKGGERSRFKSERLIITSSSSRDPKAIPETLDAVALRNPVKINNFKGGNRGGVRLGHQRGGQNRKFPRNPNIHVNPHFKPRIPMGGPHLWNSGFQGPPHPQFQPPHPPFGGFIPPPMQPPGWNGPGYYTPPAASPFNQPPIDNMYYGQDGYYQNQQNFQSPTLVQPQMGWGDNFYSGPQPTNFQPGSYFPAGPDPQMGPPRMRPPFPPGPPRPPFGMNQNRLPFMGKPPMQQVPIRPGFVRPLKREFHNQNKIPPMKQQKFENAAPRVRSNLEEVKIVDSVPLPQPTEPAPVIEEEDEEMKAYRKKIEEQKKLREKILKEKEQKRLVAAQQKAQESAARLGLIKGTIGEPTALTKPTPVDDGPPGVNGKKVQLSDIPQYKVVRVRGADGRVVLKKISLSLVEIKTVKKVPTVAKPSIIPSVEFPSRVVSIENLSASTTQKQIETLAGKIGPLEKVELDSNKKTAIIRFIRVDSAKDFVTKYHRKMVDLSMIGVKFVKED